jgi:hypothetical protein
LTSDTAGQSAGPGAAVLRLATEERLGALVETFPAKKLGRWRMAAFWFLIVLFFVPVVTIPLGIWFLWMALRTPNLSKKFAAKKVLLFEQGLILAGRDGPSAAYQFDSMAVTQTITEAQTYGISRITHVFWVTDHTGHSEKLTELYDRIDGLGRAIQSGVARAQLPGVLAELEGGREVVLGDLRLSRAAVGLRNATLPWAEVNSIEIRGDYLAVERIGKRIASTIVVKKIPNLFLFLAAANHMLDRSH